MRSLHPSAHSAHNGHPFLITKRIPGARMVAMMIMRSLLRISHCKLCCCFTSSGAHLQRSL
eukprot:scaffold64277_cov19-Tisochrysis_lutea.AAC.2